MQGMVWGLSTAIIMTTMARIFKWTTGKPMKSRHEIAFWASGVFGLTAILMIAHIGLIKPIQDKISNNKPPNPNLHCSFVDGGITSAWLAFSIDTATQDDLQRIGNRFILKFEDCDGNVTSITNVVDQKGGRLKNAS